MFSSLMILLPLQFAACCTVNDQPLAWLEKEAAEIGSVLRSVEAFEATRLGPEEMDYLATSPE